MKKPSLKIDEFNKTFYLDHSFLTQGKTYTFISSDVTAGDTSLTVQSIAGISDTAKILLIGELGDEKTEFGVFSHHTAPSGTSIYLYTGTTFAHPQDTKVYIVDYDSFALLRATATTSEKSTLVTGSIQVGQKSLESNWIDTTNTTGYGFVEFKDSIAASFSTASDPVPYGGYDDGTVFKIKERALQSIDEKIDGDIITHPFLNAALWELRREYHRSPGKRPFRRKYNTDIGNVTTGMYRIAVPTDLEAPYTAENVYGVRIGHQDNMAHVDKKEIDEDYEGVAHTILDQAYTVGDQDLWCSDVRDFDDSGSVNVEGDTIKYSAKSVGGGTLRISTDGDYNHSAELDVWQGESDGLPSEFTVFVDSKGTAAIYFNCPVDTAYVSQNIWCDYYRTLVDYDSDADELDEPEHDIFVPGLAWKIKKRKNKGLIDINDSDYQLWTFKKANALAKEYIGEDIRIKPDVGHLPFPT